MLTLLAWVFLFVVVGAVIYLSLSPIIWIPAIAILLSYYTYYQVISLFFLIVFWLIWGFLTFFIVLGPIRRQLFTLPLLHWFRRQQPKLSQSEKEVLEAGGLWWEEQIFTGKPDWRELHEIPKAKLTKAEQKFLDHQVNELCGMLDDWKIVHDTKDLPPEVWAYIKKEKFFGLTIAKKYAGHGFSAVAHSSIISKIASRSYSAALTIMVPNSLGPAEFLQHFGTDQQKTQYLSKLAKGEEIPCFALTAPTAGSDATSITDTGIVCYGEHEGQKTLGIKLNFDKRYITLAPVATLIGLAFQLKDPEQLIGDEEDIGITLALIPADQPRVEAGARHNPLHLAFMNGPVRGHDVFIPMDWVIGGQERIGKGWQMMMECLALGRGISLPALSTATAQLCFRTTGAYAYIRQQFNRSIGEFEGVKEAMSRIAGFTYIAEATRLFTAQAVDANVRPSVASAITKYHLTEMARKTVAHAMDIHGGRGIQAGPRNYLANMYDGMPTSITVEGANILTRNLIIFGQGAMRCHPLLTKEIAAAQDPSDRKKVRVFDHLILKHIGFSVGCAFRSVVMGLTGGRLVCSPVKGKIAYYYRQLTRMSNAFVLISDISLALIGRQFKIRETLSARLGDVMSHLYLASAVLKYFHDHDSPDDEWPFVQWSLDYCLYQISTVLRRYCNNFPIKWLGKLMFNWVFPFSRGYKYPADSVSFELADLMQNGAELRDRLTPVCYRNQKADDPIGRMELAFAKTKATEAYWEAIDDAISNEKIRDHGDQEQLFADAVAANVLTQAEVQELRDAELHRLDAIQVDEFEAKA